METIQDVRKALKPLGFNIKTVSTSWGKAATYIHTESAARLDFNVFTPEQRETWKPLFDWQSANGDALKRVRKNENCTGLL